jgi:hypothetical protein
VSRSRVVWVVLVVLTVAAVGVGAWFFVRDEYPFQEVGDGDVLALVYARSEASGRVFGYVDDPPADLAVWISRWERDADGEAVSTEDTVTVMLRDGRRLRLEVGGSRGYASWIGSDGKAGDSFGVHFNEAFVWYVRGLRAGVEAGPAVETTPTPR